VAAASLWVGGLAALLWVASRGSKRLPAALHRYSALAAWAFVALAVAGAINGSTRLVHLADLTSMSYGVILLVKAGVLGLAGFWAWRIRRKVANSGTGLLRLASVELVTMTIAIGLGVALGRTPPPAATVTTTPAEELLGGPLPPAPTVGRLLWGWEPTGVALAVVLFGAALYLAGLGVLRRRGDRWPVGRVVAWFAGLAVVAWAGVGGLSQYAHVLFSAHMGSHMMLGMVAPILLVLVRCS
jgi:putative copper resistance protein D